MTGWEDSLVSTFSHVFGSTEVMGIVFILVSTIIIVVMKPPEVVSMVAVGLIILLIAGNMWGGFGTLPVLIIGLALAFSILIYFASKRVVRDY
jgi:hypothetical protein